MGGLACSVHVSLTGSSMNVMNYFQEQTSLMHLISPAPERVGVGVGDRLRSVNVVHVVQCHFYIIMYVVFYYILPPAGKKPWATLTVSAW